MYAYDQPHYETQRYTGFCKGVLAGLSPQERKIARSKSVYSGHGRLLNMDVQNAVSEEGWGYGMSRRRTSASAGYFLTTVSPGSSLEECLQGSTCEYLRKALCCIKHDSQGRYVKADMVQVLKDALPKSQSVLTRMVANANDATLEAFSEFSGSGSAALRVPCIDAADNAVCAGPYIFLNKKNPATKPFVPKELQGLISLINMDGILRRRSERNYIERILYNGALLCGVISLDDAYKCYLQQGSEFKYTKQTFVSKAKTLCGNSNCMRIFELGDTLYVRFMPNKIVLESNLSSGPKYERHGLSQAPSGLTSGSLVEQHESISTRAFSMSHKYTDVGAYIYALPAVAKLTSYFDEHVPYGKSDELFAENEVDEVLSMMLFNHYSLAEIARTLAMRGWYKAEGTNVAITLTQIIRTLYRELPRWELNGWSIGECEGLHNIPTVISDASYKDVSQLLAS